MWKNIIPRLFPLESHQFLFEGISVWSWTKYVYVEHGWLRSTRRIYVPVIIIVLIIVCRKDITRKIGFYLVSNV